MTIKDLKNIEPLKCKKIVCYDDDGKPLKIYESIAEAARELKTSRERVAQSLYLGCRTMNKYRFKRLQDVIDKGSE